MECYLKYGNKYVKRTRTRSIKTVDAILGPKAKARIYGTERDAKKARTTQEFQFKELAGKMEIVPVKKIKVIENEEVDSNKTTPD